ncbi:MAG TPA: 2-C-methyl-D-erythritol 4-phosphate cytidylyltransferase [Dehalococcoidia bacterium]|nr:2-C-methyl-D-erythritol 4-phosphate cytidylyltransferase [Dehalococcoidia bacterium]
MPRVGAIILAAGRSERMGSEDKLFMPLAGQPLLAHALTAFQQCTQVEKIALVLSTANYERGQELVSGQGMNKVKAVCLGGPRRQDSVRLGLDALGQCEWVTVHDGARPLVTPELIQRGLEAALKTGAAVPAIRISDTVKRCDEEGRVLQTLDRSQLWAVQTPQMFRYELLLEAHRRISEDVTDDAAMLEALGRDVAIFPGSGLNPKITSPDDLELAEAIMQMRQGSPAAKL